MKNDKMKNQYRVNEQIRARDVRVCPTGALVKVNFPVKKAKPAAEAAPKAEAPVAAPKAEVSEEKKED